MACRWLLGWILGSHVARLGDKIHGARLEKGRRAWLVLLIQLPFFGPGHVIAQPAGIDLKPYL